MNPNYPWDIKISGDLLANPNTAATVLHMIVLQAYGDALYGDGDTDPMDPVELWLAIQEDFRTRVPEENENRLNALMLAMSTDAFYEDPVVFRSVCMSLAEGDLGDQVEGFMEELELSEMLWGVYEVELNRDDRMEFEPDVEEIIDEAISSSGVVDEAELEAYVEEYRQEMLADLMRLGVDPTVLRRIEMADLTPAT